MWLYLIHLGGLVEAREERGGCREGRGGGGEGKGNRVGARGKRYDAVFIGPVLCVFAKEDTATSKATKGSHCNLSNRHKHVYCSASSHWRDRSHYNHVRCCVRSLLFGDVACLFIVGTAEG